MLPAYKPRPLKNLFTANQCWPALLDAGGLRDIEVEAVTKMLACGTSILGVKQYTCANDGCHHAKYLCNTCKCRACPSCGKKATDQWIAAQHCQSASNSFQVTASKTFQLATRFSSVSGVRGAMEQCDLRSSEFLFYWRVFLLMKPVVPSTVSYLDTRGR